MRPPGSRSRGKAHRRRARGARADKLEAVTVRIVRCECFHKTFTELKAAAERTGATTLEELQEHVEFGISCRLCNPYVRRMLVTGETVFHELLDDAPPPEPKPLVPKPDDE